MQLGLPAESLRKGVENHLPTSSSGRKANKLPLGVCTLRVKRSTRLLQHIYGAIQEYGGFDEPAWLDGPPRKPQRVALGEQQLEQRLLGVQAVLGLVPDGRAFAVEQLLGDLLPGWAGRQCMTIAWGAAAASSSAFSWYGARSARRWAASASSPIETQTSV